MTNVKYVKFELDLSVRHDCQFYNSLGKLFFNLKVFVSGFKSASGYSLATTRSTKLDVKENVDYPYTIFKVDSKQLTIKDIKETPVGQTVNIVI